MTQVGKVTELTLERYRLGELSDADSLRLREQIGADPALRARLVELDRSGAELLRAHPPHVFVNAVKARAAAAPPPSRSVRPWALLLPASAVAGLLALLLIDIRPNDSPPNTQPQWTAASGAEGDRLKGEGPSLLVFTKRGEQNIEQLQPGATSHRGDIVQIAYRGGARTYGVILSIDGRGRVTRHLPLTGDQAALLRQGGATTLDIAYKLDDAPRGERFYFVAADEPFEVAQALLAARHPGLDPLVADRLPLSQSFAQASFLLKKE